MKDDRDPRQRLLHAIDLALVHDWSEAKSAAESIEHPIAERLFLLLSDIEEREAERRRHIAAVRHEIGNALSIAQANLEAIIDGLLEATPERLNALLDALSSASLMLDSLRRAPDTDSIEVMHVEAFNICALIEAHIASLRRLSEEKNVGLRYESCMQHNDACLHYRGDAARVGRIIHSVLNHAIRLTPPGGTVFVDCAGRDHALRLAVHDHHTNADVPVLNRILKAIGAEAHIEIEDDEHRSVLVIDLPLTPVSGQP